MSVISIKTAENFENRPTSVRLLDFYSDLASGNFSNFQDLYAEDVHFEDPTHAINGKERLKNHFLTLYNNCDSCSFKFHQTIDAGSEIFLAWTMFIRHPQIRGGKTVRVEGSSFIKTQDRQVIYHREYYDLGSLVYENLPVLGWITRFVKSRLAR